MHGELLAGRYQVIQPLGAGGMGQTYTAADTQRPGQPTCVVKQLKPPSHEPHLWATAQRLFTKEAEVLEQLGHHPQIPTLLAYFEQDQEFYLVQELIVGHPLSQELQPGQQWSEPQVLAFLSDMLTLLEFVHGQDVIHRDIKPDNIIRRRADGKLVLIDFGAVKQVRSHAPALTQNMSKSVTIGTPGYMPSEQVMGQPRPSSDLYALGKIGIQALTGRLPVQLQEDADGEVVWRDEAQVSEGLAQVVSQMVRHYFKLRYPSAAEAHQALQQVQMTRVNDTPAFTGQTADRPHPPSASVTQLQADGTHPADTYPTAVVTSVPPQASPSLRSQLPLLMGAGIIAGGLIAAAVIWRFSPSPQPARLPPTTSTASTDVGLDWLAKAKAEAASSGNLGTAIKRAQAISPESGAHQEAQQLLKQWQADWRQQNAFYDQAKLALDAGRWLEAKAAVQALPENAYWTAKARPIFSQAEQELAAQNSPAPTPIASPSPSPSAFPTPTASPSAPPTPSESPTPSPNPTPTASGSPSTPAAAFPAGTFRDRLWEVVLSAQGNTFNYQGYNLKSGDSLALSGASVRSQGNRRIYTWNNGGYLYQVTWRPQVPKLIRLQVFTPAGERLLNRLLRQQG